jgi:lysophospholipase L1-like esterase
MSSRRRWSGMTAAALMLAIALRALAQQSPPAPSIAQPAAPASVAGPPPNPSAAATAADHRDMMTQLGIKVLRPGPTASESAPNHANYDERVASPPSWKYFIPWADKFLEHSSAAADRPAPPRDANSMLAHQQLLKKAKQGRIDVYFVGDSIVRRWGALDYPELLANWTRNFHGWHAGNFGWGGDRTEHILWRLENGELDGVNPKVIVVLAGTNNVDREPRDAQTIAGIARGIKAIVDVCRKKAPEASIILTAMFPRNDNPAVMPAIARINEQIAAFADGRRVRFLNINDRLADANGTLVKGVMNERDKLHPTLEGYQIWADALKPILSELLGPPAPIDLAPPPTGDPAAAGRIRSQRSAPAVASAVGTLRREIVWKWRAAPCHRVQQLACGPFAVDTPRVETYDAPSPTHDPLIR